MVNILIDSEGHVFVGTALNEPGEPHSILYDWRYIIKSIDDFELTRAAKSLVLRPWGLRYVSKLRFYSKVNIYIVLVLIRMFIAGVFRKHFHVIG